MKNVIGVLLPQSNQYGSIGKDFMRGLKLATDGCGVEYKIEGIGFGEDPKKLIDVAQKLINQEELLLTTGLLGHGGVPELSKFMDDADEVLLYSDLGATIPYGLPTYSKVFCNSFDLTGSVYALGKYFEETNITDVAVSTCYYDAGYGFIDALGKSIMDGGKTNFSGHFITPLEPRPNEASLMKDFVEETSPQAIFASYNGAYAKEHLNFIKENGVNRTAPFYATPFSFSRQMIEENNEFLEGVSLISTWAPQLQSAPNKSFIGAYDEAYGNTPSEFALLGYENGLMICYLIEQAAATSEKNVAKLLQACTTEGPRGEIMFDTNTNRTQHDHFLFTVQNVTEVPTNQNKMNTLPRVQNEFWNEVRSTEPPKSFGGWFNAYLCH